jgi:AcrR family transcriptional regulator
MTTTHLGSVLEASRAPARSRAETRRRLVAAATELFARRGLHATTTVHIAREAGVAAGTFYLHFRDKQVLFREIAFDALARLSARTAEAARRAGHEPAAAVRARMAELVEFAAENRDLVRILFGRGQEAGAIGDEILDALVPDLEAGLRERLQAGSVDPGLDPAVAAQALLASWTRVLAWWVEDPTRATSRALVETLVGLHPASRPPAAASRPA